MSEATQEQDVSTEAPEQTAKDLSIDERIQRLEDAFAEHLLDGIFDSVKRDLMLGRLKSLSAKVDELSKQPEPGFGELATISSENTHIRVQTTRNTKGYAFEAVVGVDGADTDEVHARLTELLHTVNDQARDECTRLEQLDTAAAA